MASRRQGFEYVPTWHFILTSVLPNYIYLAPIKPVERWGEAPRFHVITISLQLVFSTVP